MPREISKQAIEYLTIREGGPHLKVYDDGFGYLTVGVGHLVTDRDNLKLDEKITPAQSDEFLQCDLWEVREAVERYCSADLDQHEFDALCIFTFNIGVPAFRQSTLVRRLRYNESKHTVISEEMPRWNKVDGHYTRGIYNRRIDTVQMFMEGDYAVDWDNL